MKGAFKTLRHSYTVSVALMMVAAFAETPTVTDVVAKQRYPWNGKVDITYTVTGNLVAAGLQTLTRPVLSVMATNRVAGTSYVATEDALSGDTGPTEGTHHVVWDLNAQGLEFKSDDVVFIVAYTTAPFSQYCVIDLSDGAYAMSYPVTYMDVLPTEGFNTSEYKTTKLVLRLIEPGSFKMGGSYAVTLTKPFYCGVFEVTQSQYELVMGTRPSYFTNTSYYATRPVERVSYDMIRGSLAGAGWPGSPSVDPTSFMGKLRSKTGIDGFDLPTEAQWEYACRAGSTTDYNNGWNYTGIYEEASGRSAHLAEVGRYWYNGGENYSQSCDTSAGTARVGSYLPNAWGLYDMHGNVKEWCLDWYGDLVGGTMDPTGPSSGTSRVLRGGCWRNNAGLCTSSRRFEDSPSYDEGFRLVRTLSD